MSPVIYTTGDCVNPIRISQLEGEVMETIRSLATGRSSTASIALSRGETDRAKSLLKDLNMPEDFISDLFTAVRSNDIGFGVAFDTVFFTGR